MLLQINKELREKSQFMKDPKMAFRSGPTPADRWKEHSNEHGKEQHVLPHSGKARDEKMVNDLMKKDLQKVRRQQPAASSQQSVSSWQTAARVSSRCKLCTQLPGSISNVLPCDC